MDWMASADEIQRLRKALEQIDDVAVRKKAGSAKKMQAIARAALDHGLPTAEDVRGILGHQ